MTKFWWDRDLQSYTTKCIVKKYKDQSMNLTLRRYYNNCQKFSVKHFVY